MRRSLPALLLIPAAALIVVLPLIVHGCSCGHDFDFHLVSWMEAAAQFRAGTLHPAWAFSPGWNAGEPRFIFYPPISWTLGAMLGLVMPWAAVPVVYTWLALVAAGFAMYRLAKLLVEDEASTIGPLIAAMVYVANPYMMFTAYERTAYAELLAAAWIPLLLAAILRDRVTVPRLAIPVALLWLTNAPAAVMGCYALAFLAAVRLVGAWSEQSRRSAALKTCLALAGRVAAGVVLGLGVAAFYVLPAAYERRWVQIAMAMVTGMRIEDNFLFHHTSDAAHDEVLHTASLIAVMLLVAAVVVFWLVLLRTRKDAWGRSKQPRVVSLTLLAATIGLLLTPLSAAVWRVAPEMAFLQFPWRLCAILSALVCAGLGLALRDVRFRRGAMSVGALLLVIFIGFPSIHVFRQECDPEDTVSARLATFVAKAGTDPTDEYTPGNDDNDGLAHTNPPYWLARDGEAPAPTSNSLGPVPMHFAVDAQTPGTLVLNLREYPLWQVRVNGVPTTSLTERSDGLIAIPVSPGHVQIDIVKVTTWDRRLGEEISGVSLCGLALIGVAKRRTARSRIIED